VSFSVDPDVLDKYAEFLEDVAGGADSIKTLISTKAQMSTHDEGIISGLCYGHTNIVESMTKRAREMDRIAGGSGREMYRVAEYYREEDESSAAKFDETLPESDFYMGKYEGRGSERTTPPPTTKWSEFEKSELKLDPTPSKAEMIGSELEKDARAGLDSLSLFTWARWALEQLVGFDFIQSIREWWFGEWEAWAKCATVWKTCADETELIAENVHDATNSLRDNWEGKAADAARVYFETFRDGIYTEADAFSALQQLYEVVTEFCFEMHLLFDDIVNTVLDILITILSVGANKGIAAAIKAAFEGGWVKKIWESVNYAGALASIVSDFVKIFATLGDVDELEEVPACEFDNLEDHRYQHPGDGKEF
jgi:hypothetical protein